MSRSARSHSRPRRLGVVAIAAVAALLFLATLPVVAASGPVLSGGSISPTTGPVGATFIVRVTYTSAGRGGDGWAPWFVRVTLNGVPYPLQPTDPGDHDYANGAAFQASIRPVAGSYHVVIDAADSHHESRAARPLDLGTLVVRVTPTPTPTPPPTGAPTPTAKPSPRSTPRPTPRPTPTAKPVPSGDATAPPGTASGGGPASATPSASASDGVSVTPSPSSSPSAGASSSPSVMPSPSATALAGGPVAAGGGTGTAPVSLSALTAGLPPTGSAAWFELLSRQLAIAVGGSTMVAMALFTFRRRRDDESEVDPAMPQPTPPRLADELPAAYVAEPPLGALPGEAEMPRWRRPSLRAARAAKPGADLGIVAAQRLTFAETSAAATGSAERRRLRYRMVRLSDGPDEIRSQELGLLDQGDEVELLQQAGVYWQVRTPLGQVGWIHRMTLGEVIPAPPGAADVAAAPQDVDGPEEPDDYHEGLAHRLARERFTL